MFFAARDVYPVPMAFVAQGSWPAEPASGVHGALGTALNGPLSMRFAALVMTIVAHLVLLLLVLLKLFDVTVSPPSPERGITLVDLSEPVEASKAGSTTSLRPQTQIMPAATQPLQTPVVPAEWHSVSMKVAVASRSVTAAPSDPASGAGSAGSTHGGGYDPYAGASPLPLSPELCRDQAQKRLPDLRCPETAAGM